MNVAGKAGTSVLYRAATVAYATLETPIGLLQFFGGEAGLITVALPNERPPAPEARVRRLLGDVEIVDDPAALTAALAQFEAYFRGELREFDLPLDPSGTAFQQQVWAAVARIPYGETCSYGEIAAAIGKPAAVRAVGLANGANPLPIVIPCHRVIASDGSIGGYSGGLTIKHRLLALEGAELDL